VLACPKCGAAADDADAFCEVCGRALTPGVAAPAAATRPATEGTRRLRRGAPQVVPGAPADVPGAPPHAGSGFATTPFAIPPHALHTNGATAGTTLGAVRILGPRDEGDAFAVDPRGERSLIVFADTAALEAELRALQAVSRQGPSLLERGRHATHGPWLRLSLPSGAVPLESAAPALDPAATIALVDALLDIAVAFERARFAWTPRTNDLAIEQGVPRLLRGRVEPLAPGQRADVAPLLRVLGAVLLPEPAAAGPSRLVHLLAAPRSPLDADRARAELETARSDSARDRRAAAGAPRHVAAATDAGLHHLKNEDAFATAHGDAAGRPWTILVVCDGVSTSTASEEAAAIAAKTACDVLAQFMRSGDAPYETTAHAVAEAIRAAHLAVCATPIPHGEATPPGTTIVAALVNDRRASFGWLGDSRAYWIGPSGAELLTRDHSWINEAVARGEMSEEEAQRAPLAHAITKCLGPLEVGEKSLAPVEPEVRSRVLAGAGMLLLCTDGLWNYFPDTGDLAAAANALGPRAEVGLVARYLVNRAVAAGGADNVTVAAARIGGAGEA
jgi:serine/threonine protein phosphatase PrpC